jgi:hypothetical protein
VSIQSLLQAEVFATIMQRQAFCELVADPDMKEKVETDKIAFFQILNLVESRSYCHYTRLTAVMNTNSAEAVHSWYMGRIAPEKHRRAIALTALERVVRNDIRRLHEGLPVVGYLSLSKYDSLEVDVVV